MTTAPEHDPDQPPDRAQRRPPARRPRRREPEEVWSEDVTPRPGLGGFYRQQDVEIEKIRAGRARDLIFGVLALIVLLVGAGAVFTDRLPAENYLPLLTLLLGAWIGRRLPT